MNIEQVRAIQPAFSHNWDIQFPPSAIIDPTDIALDVTKEFLANIGSPPPFDNVASFFPATSCDFELYNIGSKSFKVGNTTLKLPSEGNPVSVSITFFDHETRILQRWFEDWAKRRVLGKNKGTLVLESCSRHIMINQLDVSKNVVSTKNYWVYPEGSFPVRLNSTGEILLFTQNFVIVGDMDI